MTLRLRPILLGFAGIVIVAAVAGFAYQEISESRDLERYPPPGQMVDVDGHRMHIHCLGTGSPALILELGVGSASFAWYDIHKRLSGITRTCAYDRAGLGYSEPTGRPKRSADIAEELHELLEQAGLNDDIVLLGWSAGGVYVREFYRRFPERVVGMVLVASSHEQQANRLPASSGGGADPALKIAKYLAPFGIVRLSGVLEQRVASSRGSDEAKDYLRVTYHLSHTLGVVARESDAFDQDISSDVPPASLGDLPLVVLAPARDGENGRMELQAELADLSTEGRLIVAEDSGHNMHVDQPELIIAAVGELVQQLRTN